MTGSACSESVDCGADSPLCGGYAEETVFTAPVAGTYYAMGHSLAVRDSGFDFRAYAPGGAQQASGQWADLAADADITDLAGLSLTVRDTWGGEAGTNGEEFCEGQIGVDQERCEASFECCDWHEGYCWSAIGTEECPLAEHSDGLGEWDPCDDFDDQCGDGLSCQYDFMGDENLCVQSGDGEWDPCDETDDQCSDGLSCQYDHTTGQNLCMQSGEAGGLGEWDPCDEFNDQCGDGLSCQYDHTTGQNLCVHSGDEESGCVCAGGMCDEFGGDQYCVDTGCIPADGCVSSDMTLECLHPGDHQGYSIDYENSNLVSDQFDVQVSCDEGYLGTAEASVCTSWHDSEYTLTGCNEIVMCQQPEDTSGYEVLQLASEQLDNTNGDFAVAAQCADGYEGSASAVACTSSGDYTLEGCAEIVTCTSPGDTTGYEITAETSFLASDFAISAECATGYEGTATAVPCTQNGAEYTLSGCELVCFEDSMCTFTCDLDTNRCEMPSICWAEYADYSVGAREDSLDWVTSYDGTVASCATLSDTICSQAGCTADAETMAASGVCLGPDSSR